MGHTTPSFTHQFDQEPAYFRRFRRSLIRRRDKYLYDRMWQRTAAFNTSGDFAGHPLPGVTVLMMMNLAQEIAIADLEQQVADQAGEMERLLHRVERAERDQRDLEELIERRFATMRDELLEMRYDNDNP